MKFERGEELLKFQEELAKKYKYRKLKDKLSIEVRQKYLDNLPPILNIDGDPNFKIRTFSGALIAIGYERIVVGDYGAFIEINGCQIIKENIEIKIGQEYRIYDNKYNQNVKYYWLTAKDFTKIKIYYQRKTVSYADYKSDMYYVSPYEIKLEEKSK